MINQINSEVQHMLLFTSLLTASVMGIVLGSVFFYVLWLSAQKVLGSTHPVLWFVVSWLSRMAFAVYGLYWVAKGNWQLLLACLFGFIVGRYLVSKIILAKTSPNSPTKLDPGGKYVP